MSAHQPGNSPNLSQTNPVVDQTLPSVLIKRKRRIRHNRIYTKIYICLLQTGTETIFLPRFSSSTLISITTDVLDFSCTALTCMDMKVLELLQKLNVLQRMSLPGLTRRRTGWMRGSVEGARPREAHDAQRAPVAGCRGRQE